MAQSAERRAQRAKEEDMEIKQITSPAEIATILGLNDPGLENNNIGRENMTKAEWVQFLLKRVEHDDGDSFRIYGVCENKKIQGYMVAMNCSEPPLANYFVIIYQTFSEIKDVRERENLALAALDKIKNWALENGCHIIVTCAKTEALARAYCIAAGFKKTEDITLILEF